MSLKMSVLRRRVFVLFVVLVAAHATISSADAAMIPIADSQFDSANGTGSVGGALALAGASGKIGTTPWTGTYNGLQVGFLTLAAPTLSIANGQATISNVSSLLGQQNGGYFSQILTTNYTAGSTYTLTADVNPGSLLGSSFFGNTGVGIALTDGSGSVLASSLTAPSSNMNVNLLSGTTYQITLSYIAGTGQSGPIGIRLFDLPTGIANLNLLNSVSFDNVTLIATNAVPAPASLPLLGLGVGALGLVRNRRVRSGRSPQAPDSLS